MITDLKIDEERKKLYYEKGYWTSETLNDVWSRQVAAYGSKTYVKDDLGACYTYKEVDEKASRLASWMRDEGVRDGDIVSFQVPICATFTIVYVACLKVGAVMHPLPINFSCEELEYVMNLVGTRLFICPTMHCKTDYEAQITEIRDLLRNVSGVGLIDDEAPAQGTEFLTLSSILEEYDPIEKKPRAKADDVAVILSTSGTTGRPKQVLLTHNNVIFSERSFCNGYHRDEHDVMLMPSPLNHATGFFHGLISPMILGGKSILQHKFSTEAAIGLINSEGVTWSMGATPFIYDILNYMDEHEDAHMDSFEVFLCGGAPLPSSMIERAHEHGVLLCEIYGSTESCPHVYVPMEKCLEWSGAWSGIPFEGIEVRVVDTEHNEVPYGTQGEECSRGPHQFVGYLYDQERTARALDKDGWFYSGDLCYMDEENRIRINGRKKEIIIRGGENISAHDVDEAVEGCPGIGSHATIGMPDPRLGERICTFVVCKGDIQPTLQDVIGYLKQKRVSKRLWPERVEIVESLPMTPTGKIKRHLLAAELEKRMRAEVR